MPNDLFGVRVGIGVAEGGRCESSCLRVLRERFGCESQLVVLRTEDIRSSCVPNFSVSVTICMRRLASYLRSLRLLASRLDSQHLSADHGESVLSRSDGVVDM